MSVSEKMRKAGAEVLWSLVETEVDGPAFERAAEEMYLKMQAADDERNRLIDALRRVRAWLAGYVANGGKDADEELQIADAALAADDRQDERPISDATKRMEKILGAEFVASEHLRPVAPQDRPADDPSEDGLAERLKEVTALLIRYRKETPPGHSPHMICHLADTAIERARAAIAALTGGSDAS